MNNGKSNIDHDNEGAIFWESVWDNVKTIVSFIGLFFMALVDHDNKLVNEDKEES